MRMLIACLLVGCVAVACSDDSVTPDTGSGPDIAGVEAGTDGPLTDGQAPDSVAPDTGMAEAGADTGADAPPAGDAGSTACGNSTCNAATEICVQTVQQIGPKYDCKAVPAGCENDRTCACLGAQVCDSAPYNTCGDGAAGSNTVSCSCPNC